MSDNQDNRPADDDVEGHRVFRSDAETDDVEGHRHSARADAGTSGDDDVEGHRHSSRADGGTSDDDDVEGHRVPKN